MATQIGELKYSVGFDVKKQDLNTLKASLQQIKKLSISDLMKINQSDRNTAIQTFSQIRTQAENVEKAIKDAFNVKLNTVNIESFNKSLEGSNTSIQRIYQTFKQAGTAGQNAFRSLSSQVLTTNVQLKQTHKFLDNIATTLANTVKWNIASGAVNALSNSVQQAWGYVKSLDTSLNDIRVVTGKSADEMANFAVQANEAAKSLGKTTVDYTKAALIYAQQGLNDEEIAARAAITLKTANVTGQSTAQVSEELTSVWNGYKVNAEQAELYIDRLAAVAASTASDLEELSTGMSKVASAAAAMGVGEDQLAAQLSTIISVTRQAPESVGTALRTIYARISDIKAGIDEDGVTLGNYSGKMAALGFNVLDVNGKLRDMGQVIEDIGGRWQTLTREQQVSLAQTMAGQRQYSNLIALFDNFQEYNRALGIAQNAAGTLQKQQDIYMQSTAAHLNQLKTATEDLYDSLINPDSLEPLIDGLSSVINLAAKFVDSIGGGGTLLTSLGAIGISVFSDQIARGLNTTITNFEIAKRNAQQFNNVLQTIQQWKGIEGLDQSTKSLLQSRQQILNLSKLMTPEQFSGMQGLLNDITETGNRLAAIKDQKGLFESQLKEISGIKDQWKDFNNILKDAEAQESIKKNLQAQENEFTNATNQLKAYGDSIRQTLGSQGTATTDIATLKNNIGQYLKNLERLSTTNGSFKNHAQQISNLRKEFDNLNNIPESELPAKLNQITASMEGLYTSGANAAQGLREKLVEEFAETARSLGYSEKQIEDLLNKLVKSFQASQKQIERAAKIKGVTNLVGSFSQIGAAINQIQHLGSIFKNSQISDSQKALSLLTNGLPSLIMGIKGVTSAASAMGAALGVASGGITIVLGLLAAGATAFSLYTQAQQQAREETIKTNNAIIEEEKNRRSQIENSQELLTKINDLVSQGELSRSQLRAEIEKLTKEYDLEEDYIQKLIGNYDNLTESIKQTRIEREKQRLESLRTEYASAKSNVLSVADDTKQGQKYHGGSDYRLDFQSGYTHNFTSGDQKLYQQLISGGFVKDGKNLFTVVDYSRDAILQLYDSLNTQINEANLTAEQKVSSQLYKNIQSWLNSMASTIEEYRISQKQLFESQLKLDIYNSESSNFKKVNTGEEYLKQRNQLIIQLWKLNGASYEDAVKLVDNYLNESYKKLYNQFNTAVTYIDQLKEKFGFTDNDLQKSLLNLDSDSLAFLQDNFELKSIDSWNELQKIIQYLSSNETLDRLNELTQVITPTSAIESAQATYDLYSSLSDQISSSKKQTISKKEFQKLDPQVQEFFSYMANGQYKMTGDAKEFYETVNNLSLQGFKDNIDSIIQYQNRLKNILSSGNASDLGEVRASLESDLESLVPTLNQNSQVFDILSQNGYNVLPWLLSIQSTDIQERTNALREMLDALDEIGNIDYNQKLIENTTALYENSYAIFSSAESIKDLKTLYEDTRIDIQSFGESSEEARIILQAFNAAAIQLNDELDLEGLNTTQLQNFTSYLQDIAQSVENLNDDLINNADAAEIVAKSIMKMNDGFEALGKDWDSWVDILQNSTASSEQFEIAMLGARDALAQLLDVSRDYVTNDFVKQHLDLITEASNGSANAIDGLKQALTATIVQGIISENALQGLASEIWSSLANIQAQIPNFEVGMELNDGKFLAEMQNLVNLLQLDADQINALFDSLGFEPTFVTEQMPITQEIPASQDIYKEIDRAQFDGVDSFNRQFTASFPVVKHYAEDTTETIDGFVDVPALSTNGVTPQIKTITKKATPHFSNYSTRNAGGSATPKKQTKTKTKSQPKPDTSTKETKKVAEDDRDIYREINLELDQISRQLSRIQKKQQRLFGKQLIDNLNQQSKILDQHRYKLREKQKLQQADLAHRREQLRLLGLIVNEQTGDIENYLDALGQRQGVINGLINQYNAVVGSYNATTDKQAKDVIKDQLTEIERAIKDAETEYKKVQSEIKEYDSIRKSFEDITDQLEEQLQKQVEINITKFKMAVEIRLDMGEAERDWNKFRREVLEGQALELGGLLKETQFNTLLKDITQNNKDIQSYFSIHGNERGELASLTNQVNNTIAEIEKMQNGQQSVYYDNMAQAMEDLANYSSKLQDSMMNVKDLIDQVDKAYLDMYDNIKDQIDEQLDDYEFLNDLIEHDIDLLQLLYGDQQYAAMNSYYEAQYNNQTSQIAFLRQAIALVKERWQLEEAAGNTEAAKKLKDQYKDLVADLNSLVEASVKTLRDQYTNAINQIFDTLDKRVSGGLGTDYLQMEWELINKNADQYLDTINSAYAIQELERKYQKAINDNQNNVKNQKILTDLMNQQLDGLRAKDKLTQYDVDRAEKLLNIEQARMALEDQKNAKTSLRLKRDSQGNYSYVYAANQDDVLAAEEALAKTQNDLYNFDKDAYRKNLDDMLSAWKDFQSQYKDIVLDTSLTEEQRVERLALLRDQYGEYINNKVAENEIIRTNLMTSAFINYADLYNQDYDSYIAMIEGEKNALMDQLVPQWDIGVQQMIDKFAAQGGFLPVCSDAFIELENKTEEFQTKIDELQSVAGEDFGRIRDGALSPTATAFQEIIDKNSDLINKIRNEEIPAIEDLRNELQLLLEKYVEVWKEADRASQKAHDTIQELNNAAALAAEQTKITFPQTPEPLAQNLPAAPTPVTPTTTYTPPASTGGSGSNAVSQGTSNNNKQEEEKKDPWAIKDNQISPAAGVAGNIFYGGGWSTYYQAYGRSREYLEQIFEQFLGKTKKGSKAFYDQVMKELGRIRLADPGPRYAEYYKTNFDPLTMSYKYGRYQYGTSGFDTGGYTGAWGPDGRLAVLHQKELVLNAQDTKNMLDSVSILRSVVSSIGGSISSKLRSLSGGYIMPVQPKPTDELQQSVNIQASFPNVNSKREIEEAFSELVNMAAQRAMRRI